MVLRPDFLDALCEKGEAASAALPTLRGLKSRSLTALLQGRQADVRCKKTARRALRRWLALSTADQLRALEALKSL